MNPTLPPRVTTWLFARFSPPAHREAIVGDLIEEYAIRCRSSAILVVVWYWGQVCRSISPLLWIRLKRERWMSTLSVAIAAYVAAGAIESAGIEAMAMVLGPNVTAPSALNMMVGLATLMLCGYLAAWFRPLAAKVLAVLVIVAVVVMALTMPKSAPLWYGFGFLVLGPLAAVLGGTFCRTRPR